jgi:branched-chain amino acid transport system permease protein
VTTAPRSSATKAEPIYHRSFAGSREAAGVVVLLVGGWLLIDSMSDSLAATALRVLYYGVACLSFNFLQGSLGMFSLGQPVFLLVGAFTDAYLNTRYDISPWACIFIAIVISAVIAVPIGLASQRSTSSAIFVALVTLIIAEAVAPIVVGIKALGGGLGLLMTVQDHPTFGDMQFESPATFAKMLLVLNVLLIGAYTWFKRSRWGYWAAATRDGSAAANAVGVPVRRFSLTLYVAGSAVIAPAGVIYAQYNLYVTTDQFLSTTALLQVAVIALAGGVGRVWGALSGAVLVVYLTERAADISNGHPGLPDLTFAVLFLIMALTLPRGISGTWALVVERYRRRRAGAFGSLELVGPPRSDELTTASP